MVMEYTVISYPGNKWGLEDYEKALNILALDGWEIVQIVAIKDHIVATLKRERK